MNDGVIPDGITDEIAFPRAGQELSIEENGELLGDIPLFHGAGCHELSDGQWSRHEQLQQPQPGGFRKRGKQLSSLLDLGAG